VIIGYEISIGTEDAMPLARIVPEKSLWRIEITCFNFCSETVCHLAQALCEKLTLRELDLSGNSIGTKGVVALAKLFHKNTSLEERSNNVINGEGACQLAQALCGNTSLNWTWHTISLEQKVQ